MNIESAIRFIWGLEAKHEAWLQKHDEAIGQHGQTLARINAALETNTAPRALDNL